jgi:zinc transporter
MNVPLTPLPNELWILDGQGRGELMPWKPGDTLPETPALTWIHLNYSDQHARAWLPDAGLLERPAAESLFDEETRPRVLHHGIGLLLTLRGVNLNPGAEPEDMVSIRLWVDETRIISTRKRKLMSVQEIRAALGEGQGPESGGQFLAMLLDRLTRNIGAVVEDLEDRMGEVEEQLLDSPRTDARQDLADIRRRAVSLRRYLGPQRDALSRLVSERVPWISMDDLFRIRETADELIRHIEDLDAVRERAALAHEEFANHFSEQLNRRMFLLSVVTMIFLPLGFFTGLFGINVGGIPGAGSPWGFGAFCLAMGGVATVIVLFFKRNRWL